MTIAIVGGGLAAATAATELRDRGYDGDVVIYSAEDHLPYERPPLSKEVLLGSKQVEEAQVHDEAWYTDNRVRLERGVKVVSIDPAAHTLRAEPVAGGESTEHGYDKLLLATGAVPRHFDVADRVSDPLYLRTVEDNARLLAALKPGAKIIIVGAGWIGLEVASAARQKDAEVTVYEVADLPLVAVLGPEVAQLFADLHRAHGVDLRLGTPVTEEAMAAADFVVVGIGAIPATELAEQAGLDVDHGVLVDETLRTSDPDIYAIGDVASQQHPVLGRRIRVEHWDTAIEQGKVAAHNLAGASEPYTHLPYFFTDQYDLGMEYFGSVGPDGYDRVDIEGDTDVVNGGAFRAYWVKDGTVRAAMHTNDWDASDAVRDSVGTTR
ncbi:3-phenylpropionate/trans-cinnamate dioxygenase ferredoxin reductase subunit [Microbacterium sp. W4I4]|uniref:NAD(P)/FAD-dependent oxidoreductase n=1 Tax=Microbacterium sp. W4I4 TaxID=3042295 RepID=UPI002789B59B|nr:FAD-dependent oxidoreductase [Microbacterium sp. W4I4]MDQ0613938.1 3-phenylpropionate/trans-cinnamate dioxygenase ferredoxin reductase subunit [Microbacterium sp. W4I4]